MRKKLSYVPKKNNLDPPNTKENQIMLNWLSAGVLNIKKTKLTMDTFLNSLPQSSEDWGRNEHPCNCWLQCWGKKRRGSVFCEFQIILHPFFILYSSEYHLHQLGVLWVSNHPFIIPISLFILLNTIFINSSVFCEFVIILSIFLHIGNIETGSPSDSKKSLSAASGLGNQTSHIQHPHHHQCSSHVVSSSYWVPHHNLPNGQMVKAISIGDSPISK